MAFLRFGGRKDSFFGDLVADAPVNRTLARLLRAWEAGRGLR